tara:strand:- start:110 stop:337 length:228 start_codon:yes stop_codon:yes gene_type:complete
MSKTYIKLFKNDNKTEGDNRPLYQNSKVTVKETFMLHPEQLYSAAMWKNDDGTLSLKIEPKEEQLTPPTQQSEDI